MGWLSQTVDLARKALGYAPSRHLGTARITKQNKNWLPPAVSGDGAIAEAPELTLARLREQATNSPLIKGAGQKMTQMTVGSGIHCYCEPAAFMFENSESDTLLQRLDLYAEESDWRFEKWGEKWADVEGRSSWWDLHAQHFHESVTTGDSFLVRVNMPLTGGRQIPLAFQHLEAEQLDTTLDRPAGPGQNAIRRGIELDSQNRAVAYYFLDAHPYDSLIGGSSRRSQRVPAERVNHLFRKHRPSAHSGISAHTANSPGAKKFDRFTNARIEKEIVQAYMTLILHNLKNARATGLSGGEANDEGELDSDEIRLGVGNILTFNNEIGAHQIKSDGGGQAEQFAKFMLLLQSIGIGISYATLTGDTASINFSAGLLAQANDYAFIRPLQDFYVSRTIRPVREMVDRWHAALNLFKTYSAREWAKDEEYLTEYAAIGPGMVLLKPLEEEEAANCRLRGGRGTLRDENAKYGRHWVKVLRQRAREMRYAERYGIELDFTKGNGGNAGDHSGDSSASDTSSADSTQGAAA